MHNNDTCASVGLYHIVTLLILLSVLIPLQDDRTWALTKLKTFADYKFNLLKY